jgi:hypothetical protein
VFYNERGMGAAIRDFSPCLKIEAKKARPATDCDVGDRGPSQLL